MRRTSGRRPMPCAPISAAASQREVELRRRVAELEVELGRSHRDREEAARVLEAMRAERAGLMGKVLEAARIQGASDAGPRLRPRRVHRRPPRRGDRAAGPGARGAGSARGRSSPPRASRRCSPQVRCRAAGLARSRPAPPSMSSSPGAGAGEASREAHRPAPGARSRRAVRPAHVPREHAPRLGGQHPRGDPGGRAPLRAGPPRRAAQPAARRGEPVRLLRPRAVQPGSVCPLPRRRAPAHPRRSRRRPGAGRRAPRRAGRHGAGRAARGVPGARHPRGRRGGRAAPRRARAGGAHRRAPRHHPSGPGRRPGAPVAGGPRPGRLGPAAHGAARRHARPGADAGARAPGVAGSGSGGPPSGRARLGRRGRSRRPAPGCSGRWRIRTSASGAPRPGASPGSSASTWATSPRSRTRSGGGRCGG